MCTLAEISQHQKIRINLNDWEGGRREAGTKDETVNQRKSMKEQMRGRS